MTAFQQGSAQQVSLISLTDFNRSIWRSPSQLSAGVTLRGPRRPICLWDLHALADSIGTKTASNYLGVPLDSEFWNVLWPSSFNDNAGSGILKSLPTVFTVNPFTYYDANANHYTASLSFSPLIGRPDPIPQPNEEPEIDTGYNEVSEAERVVYELCTIPAYPILVGTTLPSHQTYGPLFLESASFSVSGDDRPGSVDVSINLTGGKSFRLESRDILDFEIVQMNPPPPDDDPDNNDENGNGIPDDQEQNGEPIWEYRQYRKAMMTDCLVSFETATSVDKLRDVVSGEVLEEEEKPARRLVSLSLDISQQVTLRAPTPKPPRTDDHGPRYAQVEHFEATGTLRFYSREKQFSIRSSALTLYFGGTFLFSMPAVDFAWPTLNVQTAKGYLHEVKFMARAPKQTVTRAFIPGAEGLPVSQFLPLD